MSFTLNTDLPLRLIGIQLFEETMPHIRKSLLPGWYSFVHTKNDIGIDKYKRPVVDTDVCPYGFYNIEDGLPRITITAVAGKNGSGKSTILEIFYRILNNFASAIFTNKPGDICDEVLLTRGLYARLYFEQDGISKYIDVADDKTSYFEFYEDKEEEQKLYALTDEERNYLLNRFFYTISVNYSIYAFNPSDYKVPLCTNDNLETYGGKWFDYLFHKNDGYYIPIVLTPFRDEGETNMTNESILAEQRISVLSLLYHSQKKEFLDDYEPFRLCYEFDKEYKKNKLDAFRKKLCEDLKPCIDAILKSFTDVWHKYFEEQKIELIAEEKEIELFYFAYKSVKICLTYPEYKDIFELEELLKIAKTYAEHFHQEKTNYVHIPDESKGKKEQKVVGYGDCVQWMNTHAQNVQNVINTILKDKDQHITAKIFQSLNYLRGKRYKQNSSILVNDLLDHKYETYDEVMMLMPPPFFKSEMHYKKRKDKSEEPKEITLRSMSSGERQLLNSLSYIYYHIKNIASNKKEGKRVVGYHHINLIFDEAELYYHPEFQRIFVKRLLERLAMCNINRTNIRSINIMIVTHSPFILSDIPESNILYLGAEDGHIPSRTFGANIYDLLQDSFFLKQDIGDVASLKYNELADIFNDVKSKSRKERFIKKYDEFEFVMNHIGEAYMKKAYSYMFSKLQTQYKPEKAKEMWRKRLDEINREREELENLILQ